MKFPLVYKSLLITSVLTLSGCSFAPPPVTSDKLTLKGTIIENPSQLPEQSEFLLVDDESSMLLAYISSPEVALNNFIDRAGTVEGKSQAYTADHIPQLVVETFTPDAQLSLEDILLQTTLREARKAPYNHDWNKKTGMLVLQNDNANGSAQIKVAADDKEFLVKLVKREQEWHIAEIINQEYSPVENGESTASGALEDGGESGDRSRDEDKNKNEGEEDQGPNT